MRENRRWLIVAAVLCVCILMQSLPAFAGESTEIGVKALRIAILDDPSLHTEGNASYDATSTADLFRSKGHQADVLDPAAFATIDEMNRDNYDLVYLPSGSAFPAECAASLKAFFAAGGKIITSGGYAFSEPIYPEEDGEAAYGKAAYVTSLSKNASPCLYRRLGANLFRDGGTYTLHIQIKSENISTDRGLAHASVYTYGAGDKLLEWRDFATYTSGSTDWTMKTYTFAVPASAEYVDLRLGLYITSGVMAYDDLVILNKDGKTVFEEDFENGYNGWSTMQGSSETKFEFGEGTLLASDFCSALSGSGAGSLQAVSYDVTSAVKKDSDVTVCFAEKCGGIVTPDGAEAGAFLVLSKGGAETAVLPVAAASGTLGWHRRKATVHTGTADFDKAELVFRMKNAEGLLQIDDPSLTCGGDTWTESGASPVYTGGGYKTARDKEPTLLSSNEPISAGDQLFYAPEEIPIFDIETKYSGAVRIAGAEDQAVYPAGETVFTGENISGYSAVTITGNNRGRWQPLLYAYDELGQKRGTVAAVFTVFTNPTNFGALGSVQTWQAYSGTSVGFFGVTTHDLFAPANTALRDGLIRLAEHLCLEPVIASVTNTYDCYRDGEIPKVTVGVENHTGTNIDVRVIIDIVAEDTGDVVFTFSSEGQTVAGKRKFFRTSWTNATFEDDFYYVRVRMEPQGQEGTTIDRFETGFVAWKDEVAKNGPAYTVHDNYIYLKQPDGTEKAIYANGVDEGGPFIMENQTPVVWKEDFAARADAGIYIYEVLQQYRDYGDYADIFATDGTYETHLRRVDAAVYLSQRYGQIYMMGMLIGSNVAVDDAQLEKDKEFIRHLAGRYKDVPGIIYYLNGDLVLKMSSKIDSLFRDFLKERYGTDEQFQKAWNTSNTIDSMAFDGSYPFNGSGWSDTKAYDQNVFRTRLVNRWSSELTAVAQEAGGKEKAVLCEFYSWPSEGADVPWGIGDLTYSNIGFFDRLPVFAQTLAYSDQRWQGKSMGIGESNKRTHPLFTDTLDYYQSDSYSHARAYFFTTYYTTLAMGGNHHQTWCWKDETKYVFPWGLNTVYEAVPKDSFYWVRNSNIITRSLEPVYTSPSVAIITPDSTRMAGSRGWYEGHYNAVDAIHILQGTLCDDILTLNECNFAIPDSVKVIFYPSAYTVPDDVYEKLVAFVKAGGVLYLSGDPAYDPVTRKRTLENRLKELAGVSSMQVVYPGNDRAGIAVSYTDGTNTRSGFPNVRIRLDGAEALYSDADDTPVITTFKLGSGTVFYSSDPFENETSAETFRADVAVYSAVLKAANVDPAPLTATTASIKTFKTDLADGGSFREVLNTSGADVRLEWQSSFGKNYEFKLGAYMTSVFREDAQGKLVSALVDGNLSIDGERVLSNGVFAQLHAADGEDVFSSKQLLILPQETGSFKLWTSADWTGMKIISCQVFGNRVADAGEVAFTYDPAKGLVSVEIDERLCNRILIAALPEDMETMKETVGKTLNASAITAAPESGETETKTQTDPSIPIAIGAGAGIVLATGLVTFLVMKKKKPVRPETDGPADGGNGPQEEGSSGGEEKKEE